jgi:hypothetical protein
VLSPNAGCVVMWREALAMASLNSGKRSQCAVAMPLLPESIYRSKGPSLQRSGSEFDGSRCD